MYTVPDQSGRRFVVTGSNSGTGKEFAARVAAAGAEVVLAVRSLERGEKAKAEILSRVPAARLEVRRIDLADLATVRSFAAELIDEGRPLDALINNAGVMTPPTRMTTADDFELQFGANHLGHFALTNLLLPLLLTSDRPVVATMSSGLANRGRIHFDDLQRTRGYRPVFAYAQSKLANMLTARHLATTATARGWALRSTAAHPGYTRTNLQTSGVNLGRDTPRRQLLGPDRTLIPSQDVSQGAEPLLFAATSPVATQGAYYGPSGMFGLVGPAKRVAYPRAAAGVDLAASLWAVSEELTGTHLPEA
jgi:NAD(P)-dependent dehydrogenase (short-subunit alcohol dehydrogenase family)